MKKNSSQVVLRIFLFLLLVGVTVFLFIHKEQVQKLSNLGYLGIFLVSLLSNATLILPIPGVIITSAMGAIFSPFGVALAAGAGAALGEITGYLAGLTGQAVLEHRDWYDRFVRWMQDYGDLTIFFLALIPNPLFDLAGIAAGAMNMKVTRFLFWNFLGKFFKMLLFAYTAGRIFVLFAGRY